MLFAVSAVLKLSCPPAVSFVAPNAAQTLSEPATLPLKVKSPSVSPALTSRGDANVPLVLKKTISGPHAAHASEARRSSFDPPQAV